MNLSPVSAHLSIEVEDNKVLATLSFTNTSSGPLYLEKVNTCSEGVLENDLFELLNNDIRIEYIGPLSKRGEPGWDDFIELSPEGKFETTVRLDTVYDFVGKHGPSQGRYSCLNPFPDRPGFFPIESNVALFELP